MSGEGVADFCPTTEAQGDAALAELFVHVYVLVDDAIQDQLIPLPPRPGPRPACSDAEVLTLALVRHLLGRPSEAGWLAEVRRDGAQLFPNLPAQSELNRRTRWLWAPLSTCAGRCRALLANLPADPGSRSTPRRCRSSTPAASAAPTAGRPGRAARRLRPRRRPRRVVLRVPAGGAYRPGPPAGPRLGIVPAAVDERAVADGLLADTAPPAGLLRDRGFLGRAWAAAHARRGTQVVLAHGRAERRRLPPGVRRPVAALRNRVETTLGELTEQLGLAHHHAHTFWGLLTRAAAAILAHTIHRLGLLQPT